VLNSQHVDTHTEVLAMADIRHSIRSLLHAPQIATASIVAMALAIGATTLVFSVVDGVLLRPLAFRDPGRLAVIWETNARQASFENVVSPGNYVDWRDSVRTFEGLAAVSLTFNATMGEPGPPEEVPTQFVSANVFPLLGAQAERGRTFSAAEDIPQSTVAVISHRLWQRRFGADPATVGRTVRISGEPRTIVGVMPPKFAILDPSVDLWRPIGFDETTRGRQGRWLTVVGRLAAGTTAPQAQAEMDHIVSWLTKKYPEMDTGWGARVVPMHEQMTGSIRRALLTLLGAVGLVLLIACVNVANLLLARGASRRREIAVRVALGAGRMRVVTGLLAESIVLALAGGFGGLGLAALGLRGLRHLADRTGAIPRLDAVDLDLRVIAVALAVTSAAAILAGVLPAFEATRLDLVRALRDGNRGGTSMRAARTRRLLVAAEVALALILTAGAGLLVRSLVRLLDVPPGFTPDRVLTARIPLSGDRYEAPAARTDFYQRLGERLASLPGVTAAGGVSYLPLTGIGSATGFEVVGRPKPAPGQEPVTDVRIISGDYFRAMGIPLHRGRLLTYSDTGPNARVVVISDSLARAIFPNEDPIGRQLEVQWFDPGPDRIVGVVGDVKHEGLESLNRPTIYWPHSRSASPVMTMAVRTMGSPEPLEATVVSEVQRLDPTLPVSDIQPMTQVIADSVATRRLVMLLLTGFAGVALLLAGVGIYAVMAYSVAERRSELAIRMALGAARGSILRLVVGQGLRTTALGLGVGLCGALALTRVLDSMLFDIRPTDPIALLGAAATLAIVALAASYVPGRSAAATDALGALHVE
jgi:putative ABC transport system permease protein